MAGGQSVSRLEVDKGSIDSVAIRRRRGRGHGVVWQHEKPLGVFPGRQFRCQQQQDGVELTFPFLVEQKDVSVSRVSFGLLAAAACNHEVVWTRSTQHQGR